MGLLGTATELLNRVFGENKDNGQNFLKVNYTRSGSAYTSQFGSSQSNTVAISPASGEKVVIQGVLIHASGNVGQIEVDFDGGDKIATLYSSQNTRSSFSGLGITGGDGTDVLINGGGDSFFVAISYSIEEA